MTERSPSGAKGAVEVTEPERWERAVARRSAESRATIPDLTVELEAIADAARVLADETGCAIGVVVARACALALREHPRVNGAYRDGRFETYERVNLGWLVADEASYTIPVVFDADRLGLDELAAEIERLDGRARRGELTPPELAGATFTLWDAGALGLDRASIPVVSPQAGALTAGDVRTVTTVRNGEIVAAGALTLTLACDHRIVYGARAAAFLRAVGTRLEEADL